MAGSVKKLDQNLSPTRKLKIMFNDLSQGNPFNQDSSHGIGSERNPLNSELERFSDYKSSGKYPLDSLRKH